MYVASVYSFIPLLRLRKDTLRWFIEHAELIANYGDELYSQVQCHCCNLEKARNFYYQYRYHGNDYFRQVEFQTYILRYSYEKYQQYYLVVGTGIDKVFDRSKDTFSYDDLCNEQDITFLKKAFYQRGANGFHYPSQDPTLLFLPDWLNQQVIEVSGIDPRGHFGRHYIVNIIGTKTSVNVKTLKELDDNFTTAYYDEHYQPLVNVIPNCDKWAYGLIFGNDNFERVPDQQIYSVIGEPFSNNITERTYAGYNSIVSIRSHYHKSQLDYRDDTNPFLTDFLHAHNIREISDVMHIKRRLREIRRMLIEDDSSEIKTALCEMASLIENIPTGLRELDGKYNYVYRVMGITGEFENVRQIGILAADAKNIKNTSRLNRLVVLLTAATVIIGIIQFIYNQFLTPPSVMENLGVNYIFALIGILVLVFVGLTLCVSIIVFAVYQYKTYNKISRICNSLTQ